MHKSGETVALQFCVSDPATSGLIDADSLPTGNLILNGVTSTAVTITNLSTGVYSASVTLPTVTDGDELQIRVLATVGTVTGGGIIWRGEGCAERPLSAAQTQAAAAAAIAAALEADPTLNKLDSMIGEAS